MFPMCGPLTGETRMHTHFIKHGPRRPGHPAVFAALAASLLLIACGGSGGGGSTPASVNLSGVAATGNPILGATIAYRCASGGGSMAANATTGAYSATGLQITLPCVLEATGTDASGTAVSLHSIASGSGSNVTANVTPLTELVVAQVTGSNPATYFTNATASNLGTVITPAAVSSATTAVVTSVNAILPSSSQISATDILSGSLTAGSHSGQDAVLDTLKTTLTSSGTTLSDLVTATAAASPNAPTTASTGSTSSGDATNQNMLPANLLLQPKATACASLRSGRYQIVVAGASTNTSTTVMPSNTLEVATLDAANANGPTWTWADGSTTAMTAVTGQSCHYTVSRNNVVTEDLMVAPSGLVIARTKDTDVDTNYRLALLIPVQSIAVSELAGKWNAIGWAANSGGIVSDIVTITSDGAVNGTCPEASNDPSTTESSCNSTSTGSAKLTANTSGGFDFKPADDAYHRFFAFRAGNGNMMLVALTAAGQINFLTRYRTLTLPTVGDNYNVWNVLVTQAGIASDALEYKNFFMTGTSSNSFTRTVTDVFSQVSYPQTLTINNARNGWIFRDSSTVTASNNSTVTIRKMYTLRLGVGITAYYFPNSSTNANSNARFALTVTQPDSSGSSGSSSSSTN